MDVDRQHHAPASVPPGKDFVTHLTGGRVGLGADMDAWSKTPQPVFEIWTVQLAATCYTICDISAASDSYTTIDLVTIYVLWFINIIINTCF